jgi:NADPH:quinone reductase-like Zn-dependent oxidoreductase
MVVHKPPNLTFEGAGSLSFGSTTALPFLRDKANVKRGEQLLVVGASGPVQQQFRSPSNLAPR